MHTSVKIVGTHLTPPSPRRAAAAAAVAVAAAFEGMMGGYTRVVAEMARLATVASIAVEL